MGAMRVGRPELQLRRLAKQMGRRQVAGQAAKLFGQAADQAECGVFFTASPC